jgi:hypothetical protein
MKYIILESKLEMLQKLSRERHADTEDRGHKSGTFDLNGRKVSYDLFDKRNSIFSNTKVGQNRFRIFIMNELDFLPLTPEEQKKIAEYRIKKYLEKKLSIKENLLPQFLRRRFNEEIMRPLVDEHIQRETNLCDDFSDPYEFADSVIFRSLDDFLMDDEAIMDTISDQYDEIHSTLVDYMKEWFGEELLDLHTDTCWDSDLLEESDNRDPNKIIKMIEHLLGQVKSKYVCKFWIDPEMDDGSFWIMIYFNGDFQKLLGRDRLIVRDHVSREIVEMIEKYLSIPIQIGATIDSNC